MATETHQDEPAPQGQWARALAGPGDREGRNPAVEALQDESGIGRRRALNTVAFLQEGKLRAASPGRRLCNGASEGLEQAKVWSKAPAQRRGCRQVGPPTEAARPVFC